MGGGRQRGGSLRWGRSAAPPAPLFFSSRRPDTPFPLSSLPPPGTVGAAREGALAALPAVALSLDDHKAKDGGDFLSAAAQGAAFVAAFLAAHPATAPSPLTGRVLNLNFPAKDAAPATRLVLANQGGHCWRPGFDERFVRMQQVGVEWAGGGRRGGHKGEDGAAATPPPPRAPLPSQGDPPNSPRGPADGGAPPPGTAGVRYFWNVGGGSRGEGVARGAARARSFPSTARPPPLL